MASDEQIALLKQGSMVWNRWVHEKRMALSGKTERFEPRMSGGDRSHPEPGRFRPDLSGANLPGMDLSEMDLSGANLSGANLDGASLTDANLRWPDLSNANLQEASLQGANLVQANLSGAALTWAETNYAELGNANLTQADLRDAHLEQAKLHRADLTDAYLRSADLSGADLENANLSRSSLRLANLTGANLTGANFSEVNVSLVRWDSRTMRGKYQGIRGIDSCYGNALFRRAARDQDFLDTLEARWAGTWRSALFWAWGCFDFGRSLGRVICLAYVVATLYGLVYSVWPGMLDYVRSAQTSFTPYYFSLVTYTTLGFGDVKPRNLVGEIIVSTEVIIGYTTLGLLLAVLAEKIARRA